MRLKQKIAFAASLVVFAGTPWIQKSDGLEAQSAPTSADATNATNAANNPIHPLLTFDLWNYFAPSPEGYPGRINNQGLLRVSVPFDVFASEGFAIVAYPATYRSSGVMTFIMNSDGIGAFENDLGEQTATAARQISSVHSDDSWKKVE
jgi:hypothetical protein